MKTNRILSIVFVAALGAVTVACGPSKEEKAEAARQESIRVADSIAKVAAEDSMRRVELKDLYANGLTIEVTDKSKRYSMTCEGEDVVLTCRVTNNTPISLSADDYKLTCTERYETCSDGTSPDAYTSISGKSVDLAPGESATVKFSDRCIVDLSNPKAKLKMSEEEFIEKAMNPGATTTEKLMPE